MAGDQTALIVTVPQADPVVATHRRRFDSSAIAGVPAHVTILYPFMPPELVDGQVLAHLRRLFAAEPAFGVRFESTRLFDERVATLAPDPEAPFRRMTQAVVDRWPEWPPYEGAHDEVLPHLTIGDHGDVDELRAAVDRVVAALPLESWVSEVALWRGRFQPATWRPVTSFALASG